MDANLFKGIGLMGIPVLLASITCVSMRIFVCIYDIPFQKSLKSVLGSFYEVHFIQLTVLKNILMFNANLCISWSLDCCCPFFLLFSFNKIDDCLYVYSGQRCMRLCVFICVCIGGGLQVYWAHFRQVYFQNSNSK